jgi:hypothetical protein
MPRQRSAHAAYSGGRPITRSKRQRTPSAEVQSHTELIIGQPSTARSGAPPKKRPRQESATTGGNYGAQTGTSTASTRASVPSVRDENLHDPPSRPTYRTLRISLIPYSVTESQIRGWLQSLVSDTSDGDGKEKDNNVLELSLSPYTATTTWQVATATFRYTPWIFAGCGPGRSTEVRASFGDIEAEFIIDCDFLGITPLYASLEPTVE